MGYQFLDHMTDAYIEAYGSTLEEAFGFAARALVDTMISVDNVHPLKEEQVSIEGHDLESLLYNWLDFVMLKLVVDRQALSYFKVTVSEHNNCYKLKAIVRGEPLDLDKHNYKVEIKGVTYHMMEIKRNNISKLRFVLDL
ncbi:MAG: archease [Nitrososphaerales archaeon]